TAPMSCGRWSGRLTRRTSVSVALPACLPSSVTAVIHASGTAASTHPVRMSVPTARLWAVVCGVAPAHRPYRLAAACTAPADVTADPDNAPLAVSCIVPPDAVDRRAANACQ